MIDIGSNGLGKRMGRKTRVLMVLGSLERGGAETFVLNCTKELVKAGYDVDVAVHSEEASGYYDDFCRLGARILQLPRYRVYNHAAYVRAWKTILSSGYDIVHGNALGGSIVYLPLANRSGAITIAHSHSSSFRGTGLEKLAKRILIRLAVAFADYWFACSIEAGLAVFGRYGVESKKFRIIPNGIPFENYLFCKDARYSTRSELGIDRDAFVVGHVGSFTYPKNHSFLVNVFEAVKQQKPNAMLLMVGDGPSKGLVKESISGRGLDESCVFAGSVSNVSDMLAAMDVFVFPSLFEGFGIAALEAQLSGLPTIISDRVPDDVMVASNSRKLSLKEPVEYWAHSVTELGSFGRHPAQPDCLEKARQFDIRNTVASIQAIYEMAKN